MAGPTGVTYVDAIKVNFIDNSDKSVSCYVWATDYQGFGWWGKTLYSCNDHYQIGCSTDEQPGMLGAGGLLFYDPFGRDVYIQPGAAGVMCQIPGLYGAYEGRASWITSYWITSYEIKYVIK